MKDTR